MFVYWKGQDIWYLWKAYIVGDKNYRQRYKFRGEKKKVRELIDRENKNFRKRELKEREGLERENLKEWYIYQNQNWRNSY